MTDILSQIKKDDRELFNKIMKIRHHYYAYGYSEDVTRRIEQHPELVKKRVVTIQETISAYETWIRIHPNASLGELRESNRDMYETVLEVRRNYFRGVYSADVRKKIEDSGMLPKSIKNKRLISRAKAMKIYWINNSRFNRFAPKLHTYVRIGSNFFECDTTTRFPNCRKFYDVDEISTIKRLVRVNPPPNSMSSTEAKKLLKCKTRISIKAPSVGRFLVRNHHLYFYKTTDIEKLRTQRLTRRAELNDRFQYGKRYNRLTIVERKEYCKSQEKIECRCDCGNVTRVILEFLVLGRTKSCGCYGKTVSAKLTEDDIVRIRKFGSDGLLSQREIGKIFNVTNSTINRVLRGRSYKQVKNHDQRSRIQSLGNPKGKRPQEEAQRSCAQSVEDASDTSTFQCCE